LWEASYVYFHVTAFVW